MAKTPEKKITENSAKRQRKIGVVRFQVTGLDEDRDLIKSLAKQLAQDGPQAARMRSSLRRTLSDGESSKRGRIYEALRRSPLVGADLDLTRETDPGRDVDL